MKENQTHKNKTPQTQSSGRLVSSIFQNGSAQQHIQLHANKARQPTQHVK